MHHHPLIHECVLRLPTWFAGLRRLTSLEVREGQVGTDPWAAERNLTVLLGRSHTALTSLRDLTLVCDRTDAFRSVGSLRSSLRSVVALAQEETYEDFVPPHDLQYLELALGDDTMPMHLAYGMSHIACLDHLVLHATSSAYLGQSFPARKLSLVVDRRMFGVDCTVRIDFPALRASYVQHLVVHETDSSKPGWSVRLVNVPDVVTAMRYLAKVNFTMAPGGGTLELSPFDF